MTSTPFNETVERRFGVWPYAPSYRKVRSGYKNKPIVPTPSPYTTQSWECKEFSYGGAQGYPVNFQSEAQLRQLLSEGPPGLMNRAVVKFREALGPSAQIGTALVEYGSAMQLVALRAAQMTSAYRNLRKGRFQDFAKDLGVKPLPKHRNQKWSRPQDASDLWLEYWMGWAPMVGDIGSAVDVLQSTIPTIPITASSKQLVDASSDRYNGTKTDHIVTSGAWEVIAKVQADVTVSNPNLYLANQMGFVNPLSIAWEIVPFSFLVDWFGNIGDVIQNLSWDTGLQISNAFNTIFVKPRGDFSQLREWKYYNWEPGFQHWSRSTWHAYGVSRRMGVPPVRLYFQIPLALSQTRAATAIALLVSIFSPKK